MGLDDAMMSSFTRSLIGCLCNWVPGFDGLLLLLCVCFFRSLAPIGNFGGNDAEFANCYLCIH